MNGRRGRDLEQLAELLYRIETASDGTKVAFDKIECPGYVEDNDTGGRREFDVLATGNLGGMPFSLAIECKDWNKAVDTPVVEAFIAKCTGTSIPLRMIVSSSGFTAPALKKAEVNGVQCRSLAEVEKPDWLAMDNMKYIHRRVQGFHIFCRTANDVAVEDRKRVLDDEGLELTADRQSTLTHSAFREASSMFDAAGHHEIVVKYETPGWSVEKTDGSHEPILDMSVTVKFEVVEQVVSVQSFQEQVHGKGEPLVRAVADFVLGQLVISEREDGSKGVAFAPRNRET